MTRDLTEANEGNEVSTEQAKSRGHILNALRSLCYVLLNPTSVYGSPTMIRESTEANQGNQEFKGRAQFGGPISNPIGSEPQSDDNQLEQKQAKGTKTGRSDALLSTPLRSLCYLLLNP